MFGLAPRSKGASSRQAKVPSPGGKDQQHHAESSLTVGQRVRTLPKGLLGVVRWVGPTHFSQGVWIGVELDSCDGRNDGEVQGSRYFTCAAGHGVFVRPDHVSPIKGEGSTTGIPTSSATGIPTSSTPSRSRRSPGPGAPDQTPPHLGRKGSHASLASENFGPSLIPSSAWGAGSEAGSVRRAGEKIARRAGGGDDQIIGRIVASEAFSRVLSATVAARVRTEVASREAHMKADMEAMQTRMGDLEKMVDDCGGAMDDIASMVQTISESVEGETSAQPADLRDAAAGGNGGGGGGGDAGGGGRDDARVAELTKLLCTVHDMSSQAAELLRSERKQNQVRVQYLTERVRELEAKPRNAAPSPTPMEG